MAVGDQNDMVARLKAVLPAGWFPVTGSGQPSATPILDGVLAGVAAVWAWGFSLIQYAASQTRMATATDIWLDLIALDYFGTVDTRKPNEDDATFAARIKASIMPPAATRAALTAQLVALTGRAPVIFEPARPADTGVWGSTAPGFVFSAAPIGYNVSGGWGDLQLPFQAFVTAYLPITSGIGNIGAWIATNAGEPTTPTGVYYGYNVGALEYTTLAQAAEQVTDADIYAAIAAVKPAASIPWTRISS